MLHLKNIAILFTTLYFYTLTLLVAVDNFLISIQTISSLKPNQTKDKAKDRYILSVVEHLFKLQKFLYIEIIEISHLKKFIFKIDHEIINMQLSVLEHFNKGIEQQIK
jgi:hypothetical protein